MSDYKTSKPNTQPNVLKSNQSVLHRLLRVKLKVDALKDELDSIDLADDFNTSRQAIDYHIQKVKKEVQRAK